MHYSEASQRSVPDRIERGWIGSILSETDPERLNAAQGAVRVTVFDEELTPLAERLVYRNRHNGLKVKIETGRESYTPRDSVTVSATTTDASGSPVSAELALSVVDDTVVSFADDKTGHMLSRLYLEPEIPFEVHEPNKYFDPKNEKAARALDLLLGTAGYRRFAWRQVLDDTSESKKVVVAHWRKWRKSDEPRRASEGPAPRQVAAAQPEAERVERPFAQAFAGPSPAPVAQDVDVGGKGPVQVEGAHLARGGLRAALDQLGVPGSGQPDRRGKDGGSAVHGDAVDGVGTQE